MYTFSCSKYNWIGRLNMTQFTFYIFHLVLIQIVILVSIISLIQFTSAAALAFVYQLWCFVETDQMGVVVEFPEKCVRGEV